MVLVLVTVLVHRVLSSLRIVHCLIQQNYFTIFTNSAYCVKPFSQLGGRVDIKTVQVDWKVWSHQLMLVGKYLHTNGSSEAQILIPNSS